MVIFVSNYGYWFLKFLNFYDYWSVTEEGENTKYSHGVIKKRHHQGIWGILVDEVHQ